jgi:lipid-A-disaccharide synthase
MSSKRIMIIAGEASGDMHGAKLAQAINDIDKRALLFGVGGSAMQSQGVSLIVDARTIAVVGITEVFSKLPTIYRAMAIVKKALRRLKPDLLILIDFPDFNLRVAAAAKYLKIPVLYYISPQIWAWRQNRVKRIKRLVDHMAVILPFEAPFYRKHRVPVTFVGHPLLDRISPASNQHALTAPTTQPVIGLLPGSREKEVKALLPVMLSAAKRIKHKLPLARFIVSCSDSVNADPLMEAVGQYASELDVTVIRGPVTRVFEQSHMLVAASGTVTLEAALHGLPVVIIYKISPLSYWLGKRLIKVKYIGIANLIVQKELLPELIQENASPWMIAETVTGMIEDHVKFRQIKTELLQIKDLLGGAGASGRVAGIAMGLIRRRRNV